MKTLRRLFKILKLMEENKELRIQDIANMLDLNKSTVFRYMKILEEYGYILRDDESKKYKLGLYLLRLGSLAKENLNIESQAISHMEELRDITGETVHLTMFNGREIIYILKVDSKYSVRMESKIGGIASPYNTGVGKVILAFQDNRTIDKIISGLNFYPKTKNTIINKNDLLKEFEQIRENNYALDRCEHEDDVNCIAVPIRDYTKKVRYSLSISAIKTRLDIDALLRYKEQIMEKGNIVSKNMGYNK